MGFRVMLGLYWGYIGIMEKKMETIVIIGVMLIIVIILVI